MTSRPRTLNGVTRGARQSASVGYWVGRSHNGRGFATAALTEAVALAFGRLRLHRLQAETLLPNTASQQVLARVGFQPFASWAGGSTGPTGPAT